MGALGEREACSNSITQQVRQAVVQTGRQAEEAVSAASLTEEREKKSRLQVLETGSNSDTNTENESSRCSVMRIVSSSKTAVVSERCR